MAEESDKQVEIPEQADDVDAEASAESSEQEEPSDLSEAPDTPQAAEPAEDSTESVAEEGAADSAEEDVEPEEPGEAEVPSEEPAEAASEPAAEEGAEEPVGQAVDEEAAEADEAEEDEKVAEAEEVEEIEEPVEEAAAEAQPVLGPSTDPKYADMSWYVIHAHSGHENKVKQSLENRVRQERLEDTVGEILVPSEEVAEVKGGKKRITNRKIFPGYVLIRMKLSHQTWYLVRTTPGVTGFIGSGKTPTPLEPEEVESIFEQMRGEQKKPKPKVEFEKDERVKIIEGPFTNFMGTVDEVNAERGKLKVMVEIFERLTSVELEFWQVEKI
jgi:transcriptional antiterminator NusG